MPTQQHELVLDRRVMDTTMESPGLKKIDVVHEDHHGPFHTPATRKIRPTSGIGADENTQRLRQKTLGTALSFLCTQEQCLYERGLATANEMPSDDIEMGQSHQRGKCRGGRCRQRRREKDAVAHARLKRNGNGAEPGAEEDAGWWRPKVHTERGPDRRTIGFTNTDATDTGRDGNGL